MKQYQAPALTVIYVIDGIGDYTEANIIVLDKQNKQAYHTDKTFPLSPCNTYEGWIEHMKAMGYGEI